ncbi:MAG: NUDIX domain-containing protein [Boseongicola sp.]|nr:MAG: NUDIX domain-containing protein [Boseongicola sp.]
MSLAKIKQQALRLSEHEKRDVRTQFGALCWRKHRSEVQVLLVTSRRSKRWIVPKGWPVDGATPAEAAMTEAWEEAGVKGKVKPICLGIFSYTKDLNDDANLPCIVALFPVKVKSLASKWPEMDQRKRKWFSLKVASGLVQEPELSAILKYFNPKLF